MNYEEIYDNVCYVTEGVECYEEGKTFECDCGQGFGVGFGISDVSCPSCDRVCVDERAEEREPVEHDRTPEAEKLRDEGQAGLGDFA